MTGSWVKILVRVRPSGHEWLVRRAALDDVSRNAVVRLALAEYAKRHPC